MPPQPSNRAPGLGDSFSTRPTRAQRREEAARVKTEPEPETHTSSTRPSQVVAATQSPETAVGALRPRKKAAKVPFNTYISRGTQARIDWLRNIGDYAVTDIAELALIEFLDRANVPAPPEE